MLAYLAGAGLERLLFAKRPVVPDFAGAVGAALFAAGAALAGWAWALFWKARTTRVPGETSTTMVTWGPYRFTRNPMYIGLALAYLGEAGMLRQVWPVALLPLVIAYLDRVVIPVEEARLLEAFGRRYGEYQSKVRRWL